MAQKIEIPIRLSRQRVELLQRAYEWVIGQMPFENELDHLVFSHANSMLWRIEVLLTRPFQNTKIMLSEPESIAFCLLWRDWDINDPYTNVAILDAIGQLDKQTKPLHS